MPNFRCPDHPKVQFICPPSTELVSNYNAALKNYWKGPGRKQAFLEQLERRLPHMLDIQAVEVKYLARHWEELHLANAGWVDKELEQAKESLRSNRTTSGEYELEPLSGLTRPEAIRFQAALEEGGVECRILPPPV